MSDVTTELTQEQIRFFQEQGYLALDRVTPPEEVDWLRGIYDWLFENEIGREEGMEFDLAGPDDKPGQASLPQILNPTKYAPELLESQLLKNVERIGKQLIGEGATAGFAHCIYKPAKHGAPTPWHQDASYWNPEVISRNLSVWVPLQEATPENGCMHFVPGSHRHDILKHRSIGDDPRVHGNELHPDEMHQVENSVACPLSPGGATFHGGYMLHYTPPNQSDIPRRAMILSIKGPAERRTTPVRLPWQEQKRTARQERAQAARESQEN